MTDSEDTLAVSVTDFCFETAESEGYYAFPETSPRRATDNIAFYRVSPISAITHVADVTEVVKGGEIDETYRLIAFGDKADKEAIVFYLDNLRELDEPVESNGKGVQSPMYVTLTELVEAEVVSDLMDVE
jgi:hypothetical protein